MAIDAVVDGSDDGVGAGDGDDSFSLFDKNFLVTFATHLHPSNSQKQTLGSISVPFSASNVALQ